jgi:hypothetical protein
MDIPILSADVVFHIGSLDVSRRGEFMTESLEGHLLPASTCPDAWYAIARLGGSELHTLSMDTPAHFLDMHSVRDDKELRQIIIDWGFENGFSESKTIWKTWEYDCELDNHFFTTSETEADARSEMLEDEENGGPNGRPTVESFEVIVGTEKLRDLVNIKDITKMDAFDYVTIAWAQEKLSDSVSGVWWTEVFDPDSNSAPRGGIFPDQIKHFSIDCSVEFDYAGESEPYTLTQSIFKLNNKKSFTLVKK